MKNAVRTLVVVAMLLAGIILIPLTSNAATMQVTNDGITISKSQVSGRVILSKSASGPMDRTSPRVWQQVTARIVVTTAVERLFSLVQVAAPLPAVPVTLAGPRQEKITGPTIIQTEVWSTGGLSTRDSGTI